MQNCPHCTHPVIPDAADPRNTSEVTHCPQCDAKLLHNHREEAKANAHFFMFIALAFIGTFYLGTQLISSWGDNITLVAIPPILLLLLYMAYKVFSIELENVHFEPIEEERPLE